MVCKTAADAVVIFIMLVTIMALLIVEITTTLTNPLAGFVAGVALDQSMTG